MIFGERSLRMLSVLLFGLCFLGTSGCINPTSSKVRKAREADVLAVAKVGMKFAEVRAALLEKGYQCPELHRTQTVAGPSREQTASVFLAEVSWQSTFNYSTG